MQTLLGARPPPLLFGARGLWIVGIPPLPAAGLPLARGREVEPGVPHFSMRNPAELERQKKNRTAQDEVTRREEHGSGHQTLRLVSLSPQRLVHLE